ncbi:MAG: diaminopimelate epimerase [Alphaproteobacteria bacterium]|jgi:diaminopimelate epimerase|nr:diaminopimelate epimerase [Alphaproteobacteria bacterium]
MNVKNPQTKIPFFKMVALGNDFIFLDKNYFFEARNHVGLICDRRLGVGCDQLIVYLEDKQKQAIYLDIINNDGSRAEICGNAFRCTGDYFCKKNSWQAMDIIANNKTYSVEYKNNTSIVNMGKPLFKEITINGVDLKHYYNPIYVNVGNPHVVLQAEYINKEDVLSLGKIIENHKMFPKKTNVNFTKVIDKKTVEIQTWERGIGYSESCGSGATATFVALFHSGLILNEAKVGGLNVFLKNEEVSIVGATLFVFDGIYAINI